MSLSLSIRYIHQDPQILHLQRQSQHAARNRRWAPQRTRPPSTAGGGACCSSRCRTRATSTPCCRLQLAGILHARGFAVTIFHARRFNAPDASLHPAYDFVPVPDDVTPADSPDTVQTTLDHILAMNRACEAPFRDRLAALLERARAEDDDVACLVADAHLLTLLGVARGLGVPTLALRIGSAACFRWFMAFPMLCDKGYLPAQDSSQLDAPVVELPPYRVGDLSSVRSAAAHGQLREVLSRAVTAVTTSAGLVLDTFDALEADELASLRRDLAVPVFDVGPLHILSPAASSSLLRQDRRCLDWLDGRSPSSVLYVSFGSLASMSAADLVETAWGIADSGRPFLWVLRPDLVCGAPPSSLPEGFDAATRGRGVVVSWAPQVEVLSHRAVGGFWTHCGWNSTMESVCAGVPMLCRPFFGDQMGNARYVDQVWRVGVTLDGELERGRVEAAIAALMDGAREPGAGMRQRAMELKRSAAASIGSEARSSSLNVDKLVSLIQSL